MSSADDLKYFMLIAQPPSHGYLKPGQICHTHKTLYEGRKKRNDTVLPVTFIGETYERDLKADLLRPLSRIAAELLLALEDNAERIMALAGQALVTSLALSKGSQVFVEYKNEWLTGVIQYIGRITPCTRDPIAGVFFGVELQGEHKGKGQNDGSFSSKNYFRCDRNSGIFAPFTRIKPKDSKTPMSPKTSTEILKSGDRVAYFDEKAHHGMVMEIVDDEGIKMVLISTDKDEEGKVGGVKQVPLDYVIKEELLNKDETEKIDISHYPEIGGVVDSAEITVGSLVKVIYNGPVYGIIRWIGYMPDFPEKRAGLELENDCGVSDGTLNGERYFKCAPKCGLFVKLSSCKPDDRFSVSKETTFNGYYDNDGENPCVEEENVPPISSEDVLNRLTGCMKGVQGHCNSCYMDSALFSLFSCSSVLDSLLFKSTKKEDKPIQNTLLKEIVNPLRKHGFVREKSVMKLRQLLQKRSRCSTYTTDEKDPEEFLTLIMQEVLSLDPPLKLWNQSGNNGKVETSYYYQIFMDYNHDLVLPTVQQLLEHSFYSNGLKLAEVPACLILTMPRSGKSFKMFPKIIPSTELDITGLLSHGPQPCVLCGQLASKECAECFRDAVFSHTGFKYFCSTCSTQVHSHQQRQGHKPSTLQLPQGFLSSGSDPRTPPREKLELFAVLCIETSHYVSFVKYGPQATDWIFFDSMADRIGEEEGYNVPKVSPCPEVGQYLHMPLAQLANQIPRDMEGVAKRLFCDGYMYLYQSRSISLYR
ncbi:ubiquitin carboxyl-terminal hydrolase CYLD isoform X1 [Triplophysa dalaica]|uniref:ubiquitin carboxyl-terminal hydrolase CYLD isoform X1 n=1 Tax=Triplophysa dalaica TaxID=1582913 RepID=UPI0024DF497F|nr:ubiquitin carboxyl-terminal hydrolase CYLD isoform X1 [Triplophysa dalaica]